MNNKPIAPQKTVVVERNKKIWLCQCRQVIQQQTFPAVLDCTWVNVCWVCAAGLSEPLPHYSLFFGQL